MNELSDNRVEVVRGETALSVVADQVPHWEELGYVVKGPVKSASRKRGVAKEA